MPKNKKNEETEHTLPAQLGSVAEEVTSPENKEKVATALAPKKSEVKVVTLAMALADFNDPLEPKQRKAVESAVATIADDMQAMVKSALHIGDTLCKLQDTIGTDSFKVFAKNVLPTLGLPTTTAWKYMGRAGIAAHRISNPIARQYLFRLPAADLLFQSESIALKDNAAKVLKDNPMPKEGTSAAEVEKWALKVSKSISQAIAADRKKGAQTIDPLKQKESVVSPFDRVLEKGTADTALDALCICFEHYLIHSNYRKDDARNFAAKIDRLQVARAKTIDQKSKEVASGAA